jgi:T5SS/PEP-CTERM-associated repeat protein
LGSIELDNGSLTLTGASNGGNIGTIGGDLMLCNCDNGGVTISGGSFTVGGSVEIEHGTLAVTNGGSLRTTDIGVAGNMIVTGTGSTVTASGVTIVGFFGPGALTIANGGVFNSQGAPRSTLSPRKSASHRCWSPGPAPPGTSAVPLFSWAAEQAKGPACSRSPTAAL